MTQSSSLLGLGLTALAGIDLLALLSAGRLGHSGLTPGVLMHGGSLDSVGHGTGNNLLLATVQNWTGSLGGLIDAYANGSFRYTGLVPAEQYKMLPFVLKKIVRIYYWKTSL